MRLPPHPNIVPFDRLVVEELHGRQVVVGFTSLYIHGCTLHMTSNKPCRRIFKLKWLLQLTKLVDDLNLRFGIEHQDIAPRNLTVDDATDNIMLFDFNSSSRIRGPLRNGETVYNFEQNYVKGVIFTLYEILTQDYEIRYTPGRGRRKASASRALELKDWIKHPEMQLDHPLNDYRAALDKWLKKEKKENPLFSTQMPQSIQTGRQCRSLPVSLARTRHIPCLASCQCPMVMYLHAVRSRDGSLSDGMSVKVIVK